MRKEVLYIITVTLQLLITITYYYLQLHNYNYIITITLYILLLLITQCYSLQLPAFLDIINLINERTEGLRMKRAKATVIWMNIQDDTYTQEDTRIKLDEADVWFDEMRDGTNTLVIQCHQNLYCYIEKLSKVQVEKLLAQILDCFDEGENFTIPRLAGAKIKFKGKKSKRLLEL